MKGIIEKDDLFLAFIMLGFMSWLTFEVYTFRKQSVERFDKIEERMFLMAIGQKHIVRTQDTILSRIESVRSLYLRNN
jgi:hypothetical protein